MSLSAARDSMMNVLANNYAYSASQTIVAQWNHNRYTDPYPFAGNGPPALHKTQLLASIPDLQCIL